MPEKELHLDPKAIDLWELISHIGERWRDLKIYIYILEPASTVTHFL